MTRFQKLIPIWLLLALLSLAACGGATAEQASAAPETTTDESTVVTENTRADVGAAAAAVTSSDTPAVALTLAATDGPQPVMTLGRGTPLKGGGYNPDGTVLAIPTNLGVWLYEAADLNAPPTQIAGHNTITVRAAAISAASNRFATATSDNIVRVWDFSTGEPVQAFAVEAPIAQIALSPDGTRVATATRREARVWEVATGAPLDLPATLETGSVDHIRFSADGARLVTVGENGVQVWDTQTGVVLNSFDGLYTAVFSPDGTRLAVGGWDGAVWDLASDEQVFTLGGHTSSVHDVAFSPDGSRLVTASGFGEVRVWDMTSGEEVLTPASRGEIVVAVAYSPDGARLVSIADNHPAIIVWDATSGEAITELTGYTAYMRDAVYSPDATRIATTTSSHVIMWDAASGEQLLTVPGQSRVIAFSPDATRLLTVRPRMVRVLDAATGDEQLVINGYNDLVMGAAFDSDGARIVTAARDGSIQVWDAVTGAEQLALRIETESEDGPRVEAVTFSPDGSRILVSTTPLWGQPASIWDASTGEAILTLSGDMDSLAYHPDGSRLVAPQTVGITSALMVFDADDGAEVTRIRLPHAVLNNAMYSPDGTQIAAVYMDMQGGRIFAGGGTGSIGVWEAESGRRVFSATAGGHPARVRFSPDGTRLLTAHLEGVVRVWALDVN